MGKAPKLPTPADGGLGTTRRRRKLRLRAKPDAEAVNDVVDGVEGDLIGHDPILSDNPNNASADIRDANRYTAGHSRLMVGEDGESGRRIGAILREARKSAGLNQRDFGRAVGVGQSVVSDWERGELESWRDYLPAIARVTGRPMSLFASTALRPGSQPVRELEVVGDVQGGAFRTAVEFPPEDRYRVPSPSVLGYEGVTLRALKVVGPSVNELYPDGTYVIVVSAADTDVRVGDRVVVYATRGELCESTIKEVRVDADGRLALWPRSTHPDYQEPIYLSENEQDGPEIAFVVVGAFRIEERPPAPISLGKRPRR